MAMTMTIDYGIIAGGSTGKLYLGPMRVNVLSKEHSC